MANWTETVKETKEKKEEKEEKNTKGKKTKNERRAKKAGWGRAGRRLLRGLLLAALLLSALVLVLQKNLETVILDMAHARASAMAVNYVQEAARTLMGDAAPYTDMITVHTGPDGLVTMLEANSARMNQLSTEAALLTQQKLDSAEAQSVSVPLGSALGIPFFSGMGPKIQVRIVPVSAVSAAFLTEFEAAGINQTRHKIYLSLYTTVRLVIPTGARQVSLESQVLVAESIIVGAVPDTYVEVPQYDDALNFAIP